MELTPIPLTEEAFAPYGRYLVFSELDDKKDALAYLADVGSFELGCPTAGVGVLYADPQPSATDEMEMHFHTEEGWIIMDGPCKTAVGTPCDDPNKSVYQAFTFPAGTMVSLRPGVWHFAPIPCGDKRTTVLCVLPPNTPEKDIIVVPLKETMTMV